MSETTDSILVAFTGVCGGCDSSIEYAGVAPGPVSLHIGYTRDDRYRLRFDPDMGPDLHVCDPEERALVRMRTGRLRLPRWQMRVNFFACTVARTLHLPGSPGRYCPFDFPGNAR